MAISYGRKDIETPIQAGLEETVMLRAQVLIIL